MDADVNEKVEAFFSRYSLREYKKGQILVFGGDEPRGITYLVKGEVRQYDISYRGDEVVVNVYKPGAFVPMLWAITKIPNRFFFDAGTDVKVRQAPAGEVLKFLHENPDVTFDLLRRLYIGTDGLLQRMAHLMGGSAKSRIIFELLLHARRFSEVQKGGSAKVDLTETELAARAGLSRETANRELRKLKNRNLIEVGRHFILLTSVPKLEEELGPGL